MKGLSTAILSVCIECVVLRVASVQWSIPRVSLIRQGIQRHGTHAPSLTLNSFVAREGLVLSSPSTRAGVASRAPGPVGSSALL